MMISEDILMTLRDISKVGIIGGKRRRALRKVNLRITQGDFISIVEDDPDDRDVIFGIMSLIDPPTSGTIFLARKRISDLSEAALTKLRLKHIGIVFKKNHFLEDLTVKENIEIFLKEAGVPKKDLEARALSALELVGLQDRGDFRPSELSKYELKAVAIARALANRPAILLVNEPPDEANGQGRTPIGLLKEIKRKMDVTIVITTINDRLGQEAETVYVLEDGAIKEQ